MSGKILRQTNAQTEIANAIPSSIKLGIYQISCE